MRNDNKKKIKNVKEGFKENDAKDIQRLLRDDNNYIFKISNILDKIYKKQNFISYAGIKSLVQSLNDRHFKHI